MDDLGDDLAAILAIGIGATAVMDIWGFARRPLLGIPPPNYCLVGRWFGHMPKGRFRHHSIGESQPVWGECLAGWAAHYLTGIAFAAVLIVVWGSSWIDRPTPVPALAVGLGTLVAPFLVMQPAMGAGIASSRSPRPGYARLQSVLTHLFFGLGLYLAGLAVKFLNG